MKTAFKSYKNTVNIKAKAIATSVSKSLGFIVLPTSDFVKNLSNSVMNLSKAHCDTKVMPMSSAPSSGVICGSDYLGRGEITFTIPYAQYVKKAYFNITMADNRADIWINDEKMGSFDCGDGDWSINETRDLTQMVINSNGKLTVKVEKWCRGGCDFTAKIVASYQ